MNHSIIIKFWSGNVDLWKSYWFVGEILNAIVILLIFNIEINFLKNPYSPNILTFFNLNNFNFFSKIILLIWTVFITVGIWRSAEKYKGSFIWIVLTLIFLSYRLYTLINHLI